MLVSDVDRLFTGSIPQGWLGSSLVITQIVSFVADQILFIISTQLAYNKFTMKAHLR